MNPVTMTVKQAAGKIGCSGAMIYKLMRKGELQFLQVGKRRLPFREAVEAYIGLNTSVNVINAPGEQPGRFKVLFQPK